MKTEHLKYLRCPQCRGELACTDCASSTEVVTGSLDCAACRQAFPVTKGIPRFVPAENYASSFGFEWNRHARTQYDAHSGVARSRQRFFSESKWPETMVGEVVLEAGSGSGRFTEIAATTGAMVVSFDYSSAVEANYATNGMKENVLIVQADIYQMPFPQGLFDRLFCFGVLQYTPDVRKSFFSFPPMLKPGGYLAVDCYAKMPGVIPFLLRLTSTKNIARVFTRHMDKEKLYRWCQRHTERVWPLAKHLAHFPWVGDTLNRRLLAVYYGTEIPDMSDAMLKEWAVLDLFDQLSPMYENDQYLATIRRWFEEAGLDQIDVAYGYNGINGRGRKPVERAGNGPSVGMP